MQAWDTAIFLAMTGSAQSPAWLIALASFLASAVVPLVAVALIWIWVRRPAGHRNGLLDAVAAALIGLGAVQVIGMIQYRPRPFELGLGANLMHHLPENSFPSDHGTLMFALSFGFLMAPELRSKGYVLLLLAIAVAWSRIYLGAHYPFDMVGGAVVGLIAVLAVKSFPYRDRLWSLAERVYEALLHLLHLPKAIFPRRG